MTDIASAPERHHDHPGGTAEVRDVAVHAAVRLLGRLPLHELTLEQIADSARLPLDQVRETLPDLNEVVVAALQEWNLQRMRHVRADAARDGAIAFLRDLLAITIQDPACARMVMTSAAIAGTPGHPSAEPLRQMWVRFHAIVQRTLANDIAADREPDTMDPANGAEQLLAIYEGLQFQWFFRPNMDLLAAYDRAVTRLRHGWSEEYVAPLWNI